MSEYFDDIFQKDGLIKVKKEDYIPRESQIEAAYNIYYALRDKEHFILEGPCGFGKTFAYLIPLFEIHSNKVACSIIVTDGIALQEQLVKKDLPFVNEMFSTLYNRSVSFALLKGKSNFLCSRKYELVRDSAVSEKTEQMSLLRKWAAFTKTGDLSELDIKLDPILHNKVSCTQDGDCDGNVCLNFGSCFYQRHKCTAHESEIIVTNYHVLFSDWKIGKGLTGTGKLLPQYNIAIFDEAHEFTSRFRDFRLKKFSPYSTRYLKNEISGIINEYRELNEYLSEDISEILSLMFDTVKTLNEEMEKYCVRLYDLNFRDNKHAENVLIDAYTLLIEDKKSEIIKILSDILYYIKSILHYISKLFEEGSKILDGLDKNDIYKYRNDLERPANRISEFIDVLKSCSDEGKNPDVVYWLDKTANYNDKLQKEQRISFCYKPINVSNDILNSFLNREDLSCVFTSATLTTNGNFDYLKSQTGLHLCKKRVTEFIGDSPFDLKRQCLWYSPRDSKSAKDVTFVETLPMQIERLIGACKGGALCLFTSNANMNKVYEELESLLKSKHGIRSMIQGQKPTNKLIADFVRDEDSVLFATKSFFTGIDVSGYALRCLIIDKLPFPHLNDPVLCKIKQVLGADVMFNKYSTPSMLITLKQAIGRGVRSVYDKCVVSIIDNRFLKEKKYKGAIDATFPWKKGTYELDNITYFLFPEERDYL
jgi:ATP-dependent DNA helicase DinG